MSKQTGKIIIILLLAASVLTVGCGSKKVFCGCPNEHGMSGYK